MFRYFIPFIAFMLLVACTQAYNIKDRSGNTFVVQEPELEMENYLEYRAGDAIRELALEDIVSLSMPAAEPKIFDGKVFYPAKLTLEDTVSVPAQGFIRVEGILTAKNAERKLSIPLANIEEFSRVKKE
jgi:hypothetical protein